MNQPRVPKASPEPLPELTTFLEPFAPLFRRHTSRDSMERYLTGLLTDLPHKTSDTIAGTTIEHLQYLLTEAASDPLELDEACVKHLLWLHPVTDGILVLDDTGQSKQGTASVGAARQYSGTLGKISNCQVVVSAEYLAGDPASRSPFHWPVSAQLFLPEAWAEDAERRKRVRVPQEISQQTKPEIALSLLDRARQWDVPIQAIVVDAGYGDNPNFLRGLDDREVPYMCAVESTFGCRLPQEVQQAAAAQVPIYQGRGQPRKPRPAPLYSVKELIEALPDSAWQTVQWREGTKGTMQVQAVAMRVHWATGSPLHCTSHSRVHTGPEGWLMAERPVPKTIADHPHTILTGPEDEVEDKTKYWFSVLPPETSLERLVLLAHSRWVIRDFGEAASETPTLLDRFWPTMVLKRVDIIL